MVSIKLKTYILQNKSIIIIKYEFTIMQNHFLIFKVLGIVKIYKCLQQTLVRMVGVQCSHYMHVSTYSLYNNALTFESTNMYILPYTDLNSVTIANMVIGVLLIVIIVNVIVILIVVCIRYKKKGSFNTNTSLIT